MDDESKQAQEAEAVASENNATEQARSISFSPPEITEDDIIAVSEALRSGWITTGPRTKQFEHGIRAFTQAEGAACLSSATAALECTLRALEIGSGDEVITTVYTYTATCEAIYHVGATPVLCDTLPGSYEIDYEAVGRLVTEKTKAVIPVDVGGKLCDYGRLFEILRENKAKWTPSGVWQSCFDRVIVIADAAHSLGAHIQGKPSGSIADFSVFSFHAVKNLTTGEGGAITWVKRPNSEFDSFKFYNQIMLLSLHGQTKDALEKSRASSWEYDIMFPGWKCNMTDVQAALGYSQLRRYPSTLKKRYQIVKRYRVGLEDMEVEMLPHFDSSSVSSCHLMMVRMPGKDEMFRNAVIQHMAKAGVAANVHYKPLPLFTAYKEKGFDIKDFPNAYALYENEITLPMHTLLSDSDVDFVIEAFKEAYRAVEATA